MCTPALMPSAATMGSISTGLQIAGAAANVFGSYSSSKATKQAYEYQAKVNQNNAKIAEWQASDAFTRGQKEEQQLRLKAAQLKGSQRAGMAARGVSLDEGSPLSLLQDTEYMTENDALTVRDNAAKDAWGYRNQGTNYSNDAAMLSARAKAENPLKAAGGSLLTNATAVASSWYNRKLMTG